MELLAYQKELPFFMLVNWLIGWLVTSNHLTKYSRPPVFTDSVSAVSVIRGLPRPEKESWKIKEINGS
jgi:hypothetical protein